MQLGSKRTLVGVARIDFLPSHGPCGLRGIRLRVGLSKRLN
ncbi:MAG: hypothetical protein BWY82_01421 [Verrucomicrobia bacterium ADurb.Bin474]|nr:MAG: hypothetical protein BWY82_01421 [Verrucomicrobia bacterium ADurb.Bin474]